MPITSDKQKEAEAMALAVQTEAKYGYQRPAVRKPLDNIRLERALRLAADSERLIEPEQERLRILLDAAKTEIEIKAREYQIWFVDMYLRRAAQIARDRLAYFATITNIDDELELCRDKHHWFRQYAWGYDPRPRAPLSVMPFVLFPRQAELIDWLDSLVFDKRASGLIEKSRDEGATEICVRWGIHNWRFRDGFSMLLSTRTEDEVDTKKKQGTLFERARFQIKLLPHWILPKGFDLDKDLLPDKLIANPENSNTLLGQAPVENMGRGDRVTCAIFDEFAFWRFGGYPQLRSMSQTTDSIIMPSSVAGKLNQFADVAFDGVTEKFVMDWRDHPFKNIDWYNSLPFGYLGPKMSRTTIAQEIDRNYEASQPGKVWKYAEEQIFITQSEFMRPFKEAKLEGHFYDKNGKFKIPDDWRVIQTSDYGQTDGHEWAYLLGAQPRANYPLADTHFIFVARYLEPTGLTTAQAVELWRRFQHQFGLRKPQGEWLHKPLASYISHEQKELRRVLLATYGENWTAWETDYQTGIETVQDWWTPIDNEEPNPFRPDLHGRCRLVFVAPDEEYQLAYNERLAQYFVTVSATEAGFFSWRREASAYHYPITELGKAVAAMRPVKELDDIVDTVRGYAVMWNKQPIPLTGEERQDMTISPKFRLITIQQEKDSMTEQEFGQALITRQAKLTIPKIVSGQSKPKGRFSKFKR